MSELIDTLGDEEGANKLRQELLDAYQVEERDGNITTMEQKGNDDNVKWLVTLRHWGIEKISMIWWKKNVFELINKKRKTKKNQ